MEREDESISYGPGANGWHYRDRQGCARSGRLVVCDSEHHTNQQCSALTFLIRVLFAALISFGLAGTPAQAETVATAMRSVVSVLPEWPQGQRNNEQPEGSGVIVRDDYGRPLVLTAWHVVSKALSVRVRTRDGDVIEAVVTAKDPLTDLAVLRLKERYSAPPFIYGTDDIEIGTPACAIGNAFGLGLSVTCGVVSATRKAGVGFNRVEDFVQTDAAVNPGASGGALVTRDGKLIGMLSAIFTKTSDANIGVNFAVSSKLIKRVVKDLAMKGRVTRVLSGLQLGRAVGRLGTGKLAARVVRVRPGSPAAIAGLKPGDAVYSAGGRRIRKPADFRSVMNLSSPPFDLPLKVMRGTRKLSPVLKIPATDWSKAQASKPVQ